MPSFPPHTRAFLFSLPAICAQEYKPAAVYVVDNASTDGTSEWITANGYDREKEGILFHYVLLPENIGGAGGFYTGLKMAHESEENFDAFWLMDDDGVADKNQLANLAKHLDTHDFLSPMVIAKEDSSYCAFYNYTVEEFVRQSVNGLIANKADSFNGVLYTRKLIDKVGYPIKDMFIWGDEVNFDVRCINAGFTPAIVVNAIHTHPKDRQVRVKLYKSNLPVPTPNWKLYVYVRNVIFNSVSLADRRYKIFTRTYRILREYAYYFIFVEPSLEKLKIVCCAVYDGFNKDLTHLANYK